MATISTQRRRRNTSSSTLHRIRRSTKSRHQVAMKMPWRNSKVAKVVGIISLKVQTSWVCQFRIRRWWCDVMWSYQMEERCEWDVSNNNHAWKANCFSVFMCVFFFHFAFRLPRGAGVVVGTIISILDSVCWYQTMITLLFLFSERRFCHFNSHLDDSSINNWEKSWVFCSVIYTSSRVARTLGHESFVNWSNLYRNSICSIDVCRKFSSTPTHKHSSLDYNWKRI